MARILQRLYFCFGIFLGEAVVLFELAEELVTLAIIEHDVVVGEPKHVVRRLVEPSGVEPLTSCMPCKRSTS